MRDLLRLDLRDIPGLDSGKQCEPLWLSKSEVGNLDLQLWKLSRRLL